MEAFKQILYFELAFANVFEGNGYLQIYVSDVVKHEAHAETWSCGI